MMTETGDRGCTDVVAVSSAITQGETSLIPALTCPEPPSSSPLPPPSPPPPPPPSPPPPLINCAGPEEIVQPEIAASPMPGLTPAAMGTVSEGGFTDDYIVGPTGGFRTWGDLEQAFWSPELVSLMP